MKNAILVPSTTEFYTGPAPTVCDLCKGNAGSVASTFIDGATKRGQWANMCPTCHSIVGIGLGTGKGQRYELSEGRWAKMVPRSEAKPSKKSPSMRTMEKWSMDGVAKATDGCRVEPDGICPHGAESWLLKMGMV